MRAFVCAHNEIASILHIHTQKNELKTERIKSKRENFCKRIQKLSLLLCRKTDGIKMNEKEINEAKNEMKQNKK